MKNRRCEYGKIRPARSRIVGTSASRGPALLSLNYIVKSRRALPFKAAMGALDLNAASRRGMRAVLREPSPCPTAQPGTEEALI